MPVQTPPHLSGPGTNSYLVSYDLLGEPSEKRYEKIDSVLRSKYMATEILRSDWVLESTESAESIFNTLKRLILPSDRLMVVQLAGDPVVANPKP